MKNQNVKEWMTNRSRRNRGSQTAGGNRGRRAKVVVYCPECPITELANPELAVKVAISERKRIARCPRGHVFAVGKDARSLE